MNISDRVTFLYMIDLRKQYVQFLVCVPKYCIPTGNRKCVLSGNMIDLVEIKVLMTSSKNMLAQNPVNNNKTKRLIKQYNLNFQTLIVQSITI